MKKFLHFKIAIGLFICLILFTGCNGRANRIPAGTYVVESIEVDGTNVTEGWFYDAYLNSTITIAGKTFSLSSSGGIASINISVPYSLDGDVIKLLGQDTSMRFINNRIVETMEYSFELGDGVTYKGDMPVGTHKITRTYVIT